ncbi:MAG: ferrochelatase [Planctomycetaceae bacterium]|nr:ferrochelatase [Planctomycetaceae bacterium]
MTNDERRSKSEVRNPNLDFAHADSGAPLPPYDAIVLVSFGGPEGTDDVRPFLERVAGGRNIPAERLQQVMRHYQLFGGVSPLNAENRALLAALIGELNANGPAMTVYWGNLHWHPLLEDTVRQMADDGVGRALAFVTSAFGSYSSCRQYRERIELARREVGPAAPPIDKLRLFYNHPGFVEAMADRVEAAIVELRAEHRSTARLVFTAHSIPVSMAERAPYVVQLREACRLVSDRLSQRGLGTPLLNGQSWDLVFQSRSGRPSDAWLEPDVRDHLRGLRDTGVTHVVLAPIGFLAESMELVYDLDVEAASLCDELGINMVRALAVGSHPWLVATIRDLILERLDPTRPRAALGSLGPWPDQCRPECCR